MRERSSQLPRPTTRSLLLNSICLVTSSYGLIAGTRLGLPPELVEAGYKQFLTNIGVGITIINNAANIINWVTQHSGITNNTILSISDFVSRHFTLPIALILESIIAAVYWPLRLFALKLIFQGLEDGKSPLPYFTDFCLHLFPIVFLFIDHYLSGVGQKFRISNIGGLVIVNILGLTYYKWLDHLIDPTRGQVYPYPFLDVEEPYRTIIFVTITSIAWFIYLLYQRFPPAYRGKTPKDESKRS